MLDGGAHLQVGPQPAAGAWRRRKTGRAIRRVSFRNVRQVRERRDRVSRSPPRRVVFDKRREFVLDTVSISSIIYILRASYPLSQLMGYDGLPGTRRLHDTH